MELAAVHTPIGALVAGLITSLHCAGMCGPLACLLLPARGEVADARTVATVYQVARLGAYGALGAVAGGLGRIPLGLLPGAVVRWAPWGLVATLVIFALRWDRLLPKPAFAALLPFRLQRALRGRPRWQLAAGLGLLTPLLPCGPLYILSALALLTGSALRGAEFMLAFGFGTLPLLWLAQAHFHWVRTHLPPGWLERLRLGLALAAVLVVSWRLRSTLGLAGPRVDAFLCF